MKSMQQASTAPHARSREWLGLGWALAAVAAYVSCAAFFIGADEWDPLAGWGFGILLANSLVIGLVGGR
jgi:CHASE2 domain-containing sensor protein